MSSYFFFFTTGEREREREREREMDLFDQKKKTLILKFVIYIDKIKVDKLMVKEAAAKSLM